MLSSMLHSKEAFLWLRTHASFEKLWANPGVRANSVCHFRHIGAGHFAHGGHGVDAGNTLSQESIGCLQQVRADDDNDDDDDDDDDGSQSV